MKEEETQGITHHLLGFLDPLEKYRVTDFQKSALDLIRDIHNRNKLPVLVGGTHYYIESILWKILVVSENKYAGE